jgi:hypothetical protein
VGIALENALSLVAPDGALSVVLQIPSKATQAVATSSYESMQRLKKDFVLINIKKFQQLLGRNGFRFVERENRSLPAGKALWLGGFAKTADAYGVRYF